MAPLYAWFYWRTTDLADYPTYHSLIDCQVVSWGDFMIQAYPPGGNADSPVYTLIKRGACDVSTTLPEQAIRWAWRQLKESAG